MKHLLLPLLLLLTACSPEVQPFTPAPAHEARLTNSAFVMADGTSLPYRKWLPAKKPSAVILAMHGFNDYSKAFESTGTFFRKKNIAVYAYDQRGFGQAPMTGIWAGRDNLIGDMKQAIELLEARHPGVPVYLLGESMGGAEVIAATADPDFPKVKGIILQAPAVWGAETMPLFFRGTLWVGAHTIPFKTFTGSDLKILASNNIPLLRRMAADPLIIKRTRVDAIYGMVHMMDEAYLKLPEVKTRTLMLYGGKDEVIPAQAVEHARTRLKPPSMTYIYYTKGYHMLSRDLEGDRVLRDMLQWMNNSGSPALPSTSISKD